MPSWSTIVKLGLFGFVGLVAKELYDDRKTPSAWTKIGSKIGKKIS